MSDFFIDSSDSKFVISSGSDDVPILTVSGSTVYVSGSLVPGDATVTSPVSELGSLHKPWKELYVESGSINFVKADEALDAGDRNVTFNRADVEEVYRQYIRDGKEQEGLEYVMNSGFGPISNFKGRRPESAADADAFGNY